MTQSEIIKGRLDVSRRWLGSVLPRLTPELLPWAPQKGMRTISGQLVEIIEVEAQLVPIMQGGKELTEAELGALIGDPMNLEKLQSTLTDVRASTLDYLATLTEAELMSEVSLPQWYGAYWPKPCPRGEHFRNIAEHEFYHVGQLISYLWASGDNPYEW